ncbi:YdeI/OmpD-associated family protein [Cohnella zeiphila]|uniref:YdeI/OmpD-associated family protein n=1 Tax=Cohnella zeiphila TaxID=2761120 RepID=A0A7X0SNH2_9BACL|nr:YdeI/OmpD-associated family protein [Cohnella zeiphila]MBB6730983.1 YdeI/OmpD-associated family protein [Cohnella zeiphila]
MSGKSGELPILFFENPASLIEWLEENHAASPGFRLKLAKKGSGLKSVTYDEAMDCALRYGWVDSQKEALDDLAWLQRFTPRGPRSIWSKINREKAERLIAAGLMKPSGLAAIEAAKRDGRWDKAYASQSIAEVPEDFAAELKRNPKAAAFFETLDRQNRYAMLFRIHQAKKPETREKRIREFIGMLERGETLYPKAKAKKV